jgi:trans-L-3-hydroxyproline dehydratase
MSILKRFQDPKLSPIDTVDMHTTGEPTRIIYRGFPTLSGTLLEQRAQANRDFDNVRSRLMLEPRGHNDMYGALLRPETELTKSGDAHIGVLFMGNDGFSTMCGHATIALGRFLLDTHDPEIFPRRDELKHDPSTDTAVLNLHAPCGLLRVTVPTTADGSGTDPSRPVSFVSVPSFATAVQVKISISESHRWPELGNRDHVAIDFSYGGAFYCMISAAELGFPNGLRKVDFEAMNKATRSLKAVANSSFDMRGHFSHPDHQDLGYLYGVIVVDDALGVAALGASGAETGLCYFGVNQQIDRSPTGGGVAARVALAYAKGHLAVGQSWTYNSLLSNAFKGGSFTGTIVEEVDEAMQMTPYKQVRVKVEGHAYYTGSHTFVFEEIDPVAENGFMFENLSS